MECTEYIEIVSEEIDGELPEKKALSLMRHMLGCEGCRREYEAIGRLQSFMAEDKNLSRQISIPDDFSAKVTSIIEKEQMAGLERSAGRESIYFGHLLSYLRQLRPFQRPALSWSLATAAAVMVTASFLYHNAGQKLPGGTQTAFAPDQKGSKVAGLPKAAGSPEIPVQGLKDSVRPDTYLNAKVIEPKKLEAPKGAEDKTDKDNFDYYINRHAEAVGDKHIAGSIVHRRSGFSFASHQSIGVKGAFR